MDGIVLWSNPDTQKAVIWCSDHGDLAYATGLDVLLGACSMPETGTMVAFEARYENGVRICHKLRPIQRFVAPEIAHHLREMTEETAA